jgi:hypothetical protein
MSDRESGASAAVGEPQRGLSKTAASNNSLDRSGKPVSYACFDAACRARSASSLDGCTSRCQICARMLSKESMTEDDFYVSD